MSKKKKYCPIFVFKFKTLHSACQNDLSQKLKISFSRLPEHFPVPVTSTHLLVMLVLDWWKLGLFHVKSIHPCGRLTHKSVTGGVWSSNGLACWETPILKALATIPYFNFHFFPYLLIFLLFRDPSYVLNLSTEAVLQKWLI